MKTAVLCNDQKLLAQGPTGVARAHRRQIPSNALLSIPRQTDAPKDMNTLLPNPTKNGGRPAIALAELKQHIRTLITLEATDDLVISCYLNLEGGKWEEGVADARNAVRERRALLRKSLVGERKNSFEEALHEIEL